MDRSPIAPGEFGTFDMSVAVPDANGTALVFPTMQTYGDGTVTRWIGGAGADEPAPRVTVAAAEGGHGADTTAEPTSSTGSSSRTNAALGFGIAGLAAGLGALAMGLLRRWTPSDRA